MSALTDRAEYQTADNHRVIACECRGWDEWCECHPGARFIVRQNHAHTCQRHPHQDDRHIANATEAAVREQVARDIEYAESMSRASLIERPKIGPGEFLNDWQWAARIARGGVA